MFASEQPQFITGIEKKQHFQWTHLFKLGGIFKAVADTQLSSMFKIFVEPERAHPRA